MARGIDKTTVRILILMGFVTLFYLVVAARLWNEQVMSGEEHLSEIDKQTIRRIRQPAVRGRIITSDGYILADNVPAYNIVFDLSQMRQAGRAHKTISHIVNSAERLANVLGRENPLQFDIQFVFSRMHGGDAEYIQNKAREFAKLMAPPIPLNKSIIARYSIKYPDNRYTIFKNLTPTQYERVRKIVETTPGVYAAQGKNGKYTIQFIFSQMHKGNAIYVLGKAKTISKLLPPPLQLSSSIIKRYLDKYPKRGYTVFENLTMDEYERIKKLALHTRGVLLTENKIKEHITYHPALPLSVFNNLTEEELAKAAELTPPIWGMNIITIPVRRYKYGRLACHILGYVRKDDPRSAADREKYFYYIPDEKGKKGLEKVYDETISDGTTTVRGLRGKPGNSLVRVDIKGYVHEQIGNVIQAEAGHDIILTLNFKAQQIATKLMAGKRGAFVLLDASTGAVLAMVSSPGYDLSQFTPKLSPEYYKKLMKDPLNPTKPNPDRPLFNRALFGVYEPGSIVKPIMTLALMENGMPASEHVFCPGRSYIGNKSIRCDSWRSGGHGSIGITRAIEESCNVFFIEEGRVLGLEKIAETYGEVGMGKDTEFALPDANGIFPSRAAKYRRTGAKWNTFDTALISIGQGFIGVTPLQAALFTALLANGGTLWRPYILQSVNDENGNTILINKPYARAELHIQKNILDVIYKGMSEVVTGSKGTGRRARNDKIKLYGKTGTAQKGRRGELGQNTWFTCFGTYKGKKYALTVFVEDGISGGRTCAPIAKSFFEQWLK